MRAITVSRDSWHYRVYRLVHDPMPNWVRRLMDDSPRRDKTPNGFCGYFWSVALSPVYLTGTYVMATIVTVVIAPFAAAVFLFLSAKDRYEQRVHERGPTKVTLAASYVKARKARVCPRLEVR